MKSFLFLFRQFHNWSLEEIANELAMSVDKYENFENNRKIIDQNLALRLSELYHAPVEIFLSNNSSTHFSIAYSHCSFENSNGYVNHLYHDRELTTKEEIIKLLKEEVRRLREQNDKLLERLLNS